MAAAPSLAFSHILLFNSRSSAAAIVPTLAPHYPSQCFLSFPLAAPLSYLLPARSLPATRSRLRFGISDFPADPLRVSCFRVRGGSGSTPFRRGIHLTPQGVSLAPVGVPAAHLGLRVSRSARIDWRRGRGRRVWRGRANAADCSGENGEGDTSDGRNSDPGGNPPPEAFPKAADTAVATEARAEVPTPGGGGGSGGDGGKWTEVAGVDARGKAEQAEGHEGSESEWVADEEAEDAEGGEGSEEESEGEWDGEEGEDGEERDGDAGKEAIRRERISEANRGRVPWNKGRRWSDEVRARIRERTKVAMSDPSIRARLKERGHRQSVETRALIAAKLRANWQQRHEHMALVAALRREWHAELARAAAAGGVGERALVRCRNGRVLGDAAAAAAADAHDSSDAAKAAKAAAAAEVVVIPNPDEAFVELVMAAEAQSGSPLTLVISSPSPVPTTAPPTFPTLHPPLLCFPLPPHPIPLITPFLLPVPLPPSVLMAEAEQAAQALAAVAGRDNRAMASLLETRRLLDEARRAVREAEGPQGSDEGEARQAGLGERLAVREESSTLGLGRCWSASKEQKILRNWKQHVIQDGLGL
ncbi:unnamed protein product [Closterium sp. Yama58-4]|nr:unnamed protein product [Closterium sp. Yama58-4]